MESLRNRDLPSRLPLRIRVTGQLPHPQGGSTYQESWRVLYPGDPNYEIVYSRAVAAWRSHDHPMPYASPDQAEE